MLVACQTQPYAFAALDDLFDTISAIKDDINPGLEITGIVATFFDKRTKASQSVLEKLKTDDRFNLMLRELQLYAAQRRLVDLTKRIATTVPRLH